MNNCCCAELVVDEGQQIELNVESDGGIEVGVAEQFVIGGGGNYQSKTVNITPTESAQSQTVQADVGYDALDEVEVNVAAVSDTYVGSAVPRKSSYNVAINGANFVAPAGYYASNAEKTMPTAGWNITATKGAVSSHTVSVTPKAEVFYGGYAQETERTGTAVSVSASELVSGTKSITANGAGIDVTNYAAVDVNVSGGAPTLQDKTVYPSSSDQSITADVGYDGLGTVTAKAVTTTNLTAANIVSGVTVEVGDADDSDRIASVTGTAAAFDPSTMPLAGFMSRTLREEDRDVDLGETPFADVAKTYNFARTNIKSLKWWLSYTSAFNVGSVFRNCTDLKTVVFPNLMTSANSSGQNIFTGCTALEAVDWPAAIYSNVYSSCSKLSIYVIRASSVRGCSNINNFTGTPFASGGTGGTLYVPNDLISSYQSASNWSTILGYANNQIKSIESTHTDPDAPIDLTLYYVDGTPIPT